MIDGTKLCMILSDAYVLLWSIYEAASRLAFLLDPFVSLSGILNSW